MYEEKQNTNNINDTNNTNNINNINCKNYNNENENDENYNDKTYNITSKTHINNIFSNDHYFHIDASDMNLNINDIHSTAYIEIKQIIDNKINGYMWSNKSIRNSKGRIKKIETCVQIINLCVYNFIIDKHTKQIYTIKITKNPYGDLRSTKIKIMCKQYNNSIACCIPFMCIINYLNIFQNNKTKNKLNATNFEIFQNLLLRKNTNNTDTNTQQNVQNAQNEIKNMLSFRHSKIEPYCDKLETRKTDNV